MATYYIDQTVGTAVTGSVYTAPRNTIPTAVDGDRWGFPIGRVFNVRLSGTGTTTFLMGTKSVETFAYDPATGAEVTTQFDPKTRYPNGWPTEAEIAANYAYIDGGVTKDSAGSLTPGDARSIVAQCGGNSIVRGLCIQNAYIAGIESSNAGTVDYLVDKCIVRNIGNLATAPRSPIDTTGIGIRHARVSAGKMQVTRTFIENIGEDGIWAADTLGSINPVISRNWIRNVGATVPTSSYHADCIQLGNGPGTFLVSENILEGDLPETLVGGVSRIGCACLLGGSTGSTGGIFEKNIVVTNGSGFNWGASSGVTIRGNRMTLTSNAASLGLDGYDDAALTGTTGAGHTIEGNVIIVSRQCGSNGFMFNEVDWMQGSVVQFNTFVGSGAATKNACMEARSSTTAIVRNNLFIDFENAIVNAGAGSLATENYNAFWRCTRNRSASKTGGSAQSTGAATVTADPLVSRLYKPRSSSPLSEAGVHVSYSRDASGAQRNNPPTIGAYEPLRARTTR